MPFPKIKRGSSLHCFFCNSIVEETATVCPKCGKKLSDVIKISTMPSSTASSSFAIKPPKVMLPKILYLGVTSILWITGAVLIAYGNLKSYPSPDLAAVGLFLQIGVLPLFLICLYRAWKSIDDGLARTTPGRAVAYLFIPFFNIFWLWQCTVGFAKDYNAYCERYKLPLPKLKSGLFVIWFFLSLFYVPVMIFSLASFVVTAFGIIVYLFTLLMLNAVCGAVNKLASLP
ncbi:MAG: hypothetical protein ABIK39_05605 [candidate division WOR-3 bacterium]